MEYADQLLTPAAAAAVLDVSTSTLAHWRCAHAGPAVVRLGGPRGRVRYRHSDLMTWIARCRRVDPGEAPAAE